MKPTKEQLSDPKWWNENANAEDEYCYWLDGLGVHWFLSDKIPSPHNSVCLLLAKRPQPNVSDTDWLKVGVNVVTAIGVAEVRRITEDDGVYTSLGNFCRSELLEVKPEWVPKGGEEIEALDCGEWVKSRYVYIDEDCDYLVINMNTLRGFYTSKIRPIKTQREELIDLVATALQTDDQAVTDLCNKSKEMFMSGATKSVDAILSRFDLTEKGG